MVETVIDIGGLIVPEEEYEGRRLIIFALDPGVASGWSALGVPVGLLSVGGVNRTLARCWWRHGEILRGSRATPEGPFGAGQDFNDSDHVDAILSQAGTIFEEWVGEEDEFIFVTERFDLRMMSMDPELLAPVRVNAILMDRFRAAGGETKVSFQSPSDAKRTVTDARLVTWCMYDSHSGVHARDADRHAILFLRRFAESQKIRSALGFSSSSSE